VVQPITLIAAAQRAMAHAAQQAALATVQKKTEPLSINVKEVIDNTYASDEEGKKIYPLVKQALSEGRKVVISVKGLSLKVDGGFFDQAVCQAYGDFEEAFVDSHIEVVDFAGAQKVFLDDAREISKMYFYAREHYDAWMERCKQIDVAGGWDVDEDDFVPDDVILTGDFQEEDDMTTQRKQTTK
jgi:mRNA-degrading endonuclease HigB of HigAB toxin-antitoxin module